MNIIFPTHCCVCLRGGEPWHQTSLMYILYIQTAEYDQVQVSWFWYSIWYLLVVNSEDIQKCLKFWIFSMGILLCACYTEWINNKAILDTHSHCTCKNPVLSSWGDVLCIKFLEVLYFSESILCDKRILQLYCRYSISFHYDVSNEIKWESRTYGISAQLSSF